MQNFFYQIVAHGKIILSENAIVPDSRYHVIKFNATFEMLPAFTLIVYRFENNEMITCREEFRVAVPDLNNAISIKLSKTEVQPGENVSIDIRTNPDSFVAVIGIDQRVLLLNENTKDITTDLAIDSINLYDSNFLGDERRTSDSLPSKFKDSGLILFTNAGKFRK